MKLADVWRYHRTIIDKSIPFALYRWVIAGIVALLYLLRIIYVQGKLHFSYFHVFVPTLTTPTLPACPSQS